MTEIDDSRLESLTNELIDKLGKEADAEKIARYSEAVAHITDARRTRSELLTLKGNLRLESFKSWSTILVPFLSILTLSVTLWSEKQQINAAQAGNEDQQWREALKSIPTTKSVYRTDMEIITGLKPFLRSSRYREDARDLSVLLLSEIGSEEIYDDLFDATFAAPGVGDINDLARLDRELNSAWSETVDAQKKNADQEAAAKAQPPMPPSRFDPLRLSAGAMPAPTAAEILDHQYNALLKRMAKLDAMIADLLRQRSKGATDGKIDLSRLLIYKADLHAIDFTNVNIDNSTFEYVNFTGVTVPDSDGAYTADFTTSRWWLADRIGPELLKALIKYKYPYFENEAANYDSNSAMGYDGDGVVSKSEYMSNVRRLCANVNLTCSDKMLHMGPSQPPPVVKSGSPQAGAAAPASK